MATLVHSLLYVQDAIEWAAPPDYAARRHLLSRRRPGGGGGGGGPAEVLADEAVRWLCVVVAAVPGWGEAQLLQTWAALLKIITTDATATSHFSEDDTGPAISVSNGPSVARTDNMMCTTVELWRGLTWRLLSQDPCDIAEGNQLLARLAQAVVSSSGRSVQTRHAMLGLLLAASLRRRNGQVDGAAALLWHSIALAQQDSAAD